MHVSVEAQGLCTAGAALCVQLCLTRALVCGQPSFMPTQSVFEVSAELVTPTKVSWVYCCITSCKFTVSDMGVAHIYMFGVFARERAVKAGAEHAEQSVPSKACRA